jgi:hypothetical protein
MITGPRDQGPVIDYLPAVLGLFCFGFLGFLAFLSIEFPLQSS